MHRLVDSNRPLAHSEWQPRLWRQTGCLMGRLVAYDSIRTSGLRRQALIRHPLRGRQILASRSAQENSHRLPARKPQKPQTPRAARRKKTKREIGSDAGSAWNGCQYEDSAGGSAGVARAFCASGQFIAPPRRFARVVESGRVFAGFRGSRGRISRVLEPEILDSHRSTAGRIGNDPRRQEVVARYAVSGGQLRVPRRLSDESCRISSPARRSNEPGCLSHSLRGRFVHRRHAG